MIALDTNVLVRMLADDDLRQCARARAAVAAAEANGEAVRINDVVLAETMWTMAKRHKTPRSMLVDIARGLLDSETFEFESRRCLEETLRLFEQSSADFSDCLIVAKNAAAGCRSTLTFDAECIKLPTAQAV
jgi:predicted nucleic-acid-binding protein